MTFCFLILIPFFSFADLGLLVFKSPDQNNLFILPQKKSETAFEALARYKKSISKNSELQQVVSADQLNLLQIEKIETDSFLNEKSALLILANRGYDQTSEKKTGPQLRVQKFAEQFKAQSQLFVLPIAASGGLTHEEETEFHQLLIKNMDGVLALGGADIHPTLYEEDALESKDVNLSRDRFEISFLQYWIKSKKGFLFGVCRGHQLIAVALGFKLKQHIDQHGDGEWTNHPVQLLRTTRQRFLNLFGLEKINVNSYHHQAVEYTLNPDIEVSALAEDGTVEGLESKDGLILTTQFHPEFMSSTVSKKLFRLLNSMLYSKRKPHCKALF